MLGLIEHLVNISVGVSGFFVDASSPYKIYALSAAMNDIHSLVSIILSIRC